MENVFFDTPTLAENKDDNNWQLAQQLLQHTKLFTSSSVNNNNTCWYTIELASRQ